MFTAMTRDGHIHANHKPGDVLASSFLPRLEVSIGYMPLILSINHTQACLWPVPTIRGSA